MADFKYKNSSGEYFVEQWFNWEPDKTALATNLEDLYPTVTFTNFLDSNGSPIKGRVRKDGSTWGTIGGNFKNKINGTDITLKCIKKGCLPLFMSNPKYSGVNSDEVLDGSSSNSNEIDSFYNIIHKSNSDDQASLTLTRTDSALTIGSSTWGPSDFRDGVIPLYLGFFIAGGGGGGGGSGGVNGGNGGGGGGFAYFIHKFTGGTTETLNLYYGARGTGGYKEENTADTSYYARGKSGGTTSITRSIPGTSATTIASASGGTGGHCKKDGNDPGKGGTASAAGLYKVTATGGAGTGSVGTGKPADPSAADFFTDNEDACTWVSTGWLHNNSYCSSARGGGSGDNGGNGGGGASFMGPGGYGGDGNSDGVGKAGYSGGGGGGARFTFGTWKRGGQGGPGTIIIFY